MNYTENEVVVLRNLDEELKESYLRYSMSVIVARALPDVRDGLKPSQRRILFAMRQLSLGPQSKHRKCAKICGDTSGDYHPHGEAVIYPTLVRMAQDWIMRYPLVNGQGNFVRDYRDLSLQDGIGPNGILTLNVGETELVRTNSNAVFDPVLLHIPNSFTEPRVRLY